MLWGLMIWPVEIAVPYIAVTALRSLFRESDPNGDQLRYSWAWGDGTAASAGVNVSHKFQAAGTYTVVLTVTDPSNLTATTSLAYVAAA